MGRALTNQPLRQSSVKNVNNGSFYIAAVPAPLQTLRETQGSRREERTHEQQRRQGEKRECGIASVVQSHHHLRLKDMKTSHRTPLLRN